MRNLKLIIENYLFEEEESPPIEDESAAPDEDESAEDESAEDESAEDSGQEESEKDENEDEEQSKNITADVAMISNKEGSAAAIDELETILKHRSPDFEVDISTIPDLVSMLGKKKIKKVDIDNLKKLPAHRTARSKETLRKRGDLPGGFD